MPKQMKPIIGMSCRKTRHSQGLNSAHFPHSLCLCPFPFTQGLMPPSPLGVGPETYSHIHLQHAVRYPTVILSKEGCRDMGDIAEMGHGLSLGKREH